MGLPTAFLSRGRPLKGPFYLRLSFLATRKRVHELLKAQLIGNLVLLQLIFNVLLDFLFVLSYRIHEVSTGPEMPISKLAIGIPSTNQQIHTDRPPLNCRDLLQKTA